MKEPMTPGEAAERGICPGCMGDGKVVRLWVPGEAEGPCSTCGGSGTWPPHGPRVEVS